MDTTVLLREELEYELDIRGLSSDGKASSLRKRLEKAIGEDIALVCLPDCSESELRRVEKIISALEDALSTTKTRQAFIRLSQRIVYVQECLSRYVVSQVPIGIKKLFRNLLNRSLDLEEAVQGILSNGDEQVEVEPGYRGRYR